MKKVILYYKFVDVSDPQQEVQSQKDFCLENGLLGRVLIGHEGINGTLEGNVSQIRKYKNYLKNHPLFNNIVIKETPTKIPAFNKLIIKVRDEIVTLGKKVDLNKTGKRISPEELHQRLEDQEELILIDMRNDYESEIGRFENALSIGTKNFKDLPKSISKIKKLKDKKIVTYCTGGIRCEKASALLIQEGFSDVSQLDGGILKYAEKYPDGFFVGKCFVFDNRMSVNFEKTRQTVLTSCEHCKAKSDRYLDCQDDICHRLFICCISCEKNKNGLCSKAHRMQLGEVITSSQAPNYSVK
jgi:UPF0176 protein